MDWQTERDVASYCSRGHEKTICGGRKRCLICENESAKARYRKRFPRCNKVEKLRVAARVAIALRSAKPSRKINVVDRSGNVLRQADLAEVQAGLLRAEDVTFGVGDRPAAVQCQACGASIRLKKGGPVPKTCPQGCVSKCRCGKTLRPGPAVNAIRNGRVPTCKSCCALKLSDDEVRKMRARRANGATVGQLMVEFSVSRETVRGVLRGLSYAHVK